MEIKKLARKDYRKAIRFAVEGMHFNLYMTSPLLLYLYGKYFLFLELNRATQIIACYEKDELCGLLLAEFKGEKKRNRQSLKSIKKIFHFNVSSTQNI